MANPQAAITPLRALASEGAPVHTPTEANPNDSTLHVLEHPQYLRALTEISEHRLAKARGDALEEARHLRRAKQAIDQVLHDLRERLP